MDFEKKGKWINAEEKIRARKVEYTDPEVGKCIEAEFQVFKRPYFFGLIGKKRWETSIITNDEQMGMSFSRYLIR